jgi:hypothetical protein
VLETRVDEIQAAGEFTFPFTMAAMPIMLSTVEQALQARQKSFSSANPLALGSGNKGSRNAGMQTPLGWLAGRFGAGGAR